MTQNAVSVLQPQQTVNAIQRSNQRALPEQPQSANDRKDFPKVSDGEAA